MDDAGGMRGSEAVGDLRGDSRGLSRRDRTFGNQRA
jgi:hypothetical protein